MMRGRGVVKPQLGKQLEHQGSTGQSPVAWCPTNVLQLRWEWSKYCAEMPFVCENQCEECGAGATHPEQKHTLILRSQSSPIPAALWLKEGNQEFRTGKNKLVLKFKCRREKKILSDA